MVPDPDAPLSDSLIRELYERDTRLHSCLDEGGFPVDDVPSWETYLDVQRNSPPDEHWDPMAAVKAAAIESPMLLEQATRACRDVD